MARIVLADLEMKRELDAHAMSNVVGGLRPSRDVLIGRLGNDEVSRAGDNRLTAGPSQIEPIAYSLFVVI